MNILCIDPGTRAVGAAAFVDNELIKTVCSYSKRSMLLNDYVRFHMETLKDLIFTADVVVVERMAHRRDDVRSQPNDLLDVQLVGGALAGAVRGCLHFLKASDWKSHVPKAVHHIRLRSALTPIELRVLDSALEDTVKSHQKEIMDAVGIGLFFAKRTRKDGSRARR